MNSAMVAFSILLLPLFLALRWPFFRLPLHIDTGFYVSNHTICTRRIDFSKGWNAHFAGCSKAIPELFYSCVYLLHGGAHYKRYSRFYYSLYNYVTAILVGYTTYLVGGRVETLYYLGLATYCLVSSEPHYGIYFESGEQFELLFQVLGFLLIVLGIQDRNPHLVALGFGSWLFDGFFIKLSALISGGILAVGIAVLFPGSMLHLGMAASIGVILYLVWILVNKRNPLELLRPLIGHEYHYGHRLALRTYGWRVLDKGDWFLWQITRSFPIVPFLAAVGLLITDRMATLPLMIYLSAVAGAYFFQVTRVWYYALPLIPGMAILAAFTVWWFVNQGTEGITVVAMLGLTWFAVHLIQSYGRLFLKGVSSLNLYVWRPYGPSVAEKNLRLEEIASLLDGYVRGRSIFVFGSWNQAYVLLGSSYDTPLICAERWLDSMMPGWKIILNQRFLLAPPLFLLDTDDCLDVEVMKRNLGLDYRCVETLGSFRLFVLNGSRLPENINLDCSPYVTKA